jgi:low affinity Fe/Cu permease
MTTKEIKRDDETIQAIKKKIDELLKKYNTRKEDLQWADEDWEIGEIQEDLANYAKEIEKLKAKMQKHQKESK